MRNVQAWYKEKNLNFMEGHKRKIEKIGKQIVFQPE